jgi:hypothetical protein
VVELEHAGVHSEQATEGSRLRRFGATLVLAVALASLALAATAVWLLVANPVAVAGLIDQNGLGLMARDVARLLRDALTLLLRVAAASLPTGDTNGFVAESVTGGWSVGDMGPWVVTGLGTGMLWRAWPRRAGAPGSNRHVD